jgi:uracil-DNA glycosylase family protein
MELDAADSASAPLVPRASGGRPPSVARLANAASGCHACPLGLQPGVTQTVFGEGPAPAPLMLVGEQPGDREDRAGHPFVGPAGAILDRALEAAGIDRKTVYVTNAVKHFSFIERGPRRIHQKPKGREIKACKGWLVAEIQVVKPQLIVCLGATAAQALLGPAFRLTKARGKVVEGDGQAVLATYHPSALLRAPDEEARAAMQKDLVADLKVAARYLARH